VQRKHQCREGKGVKTRGEERNEEVPCQKEMKRPISRKQELVWQ